MSKPLIYCTLCGKSAYTAPPAVHRCGVPAWVDVIQPA